MAAVNPYCRLTIYEREVVRAYGGRKREELSPHLFAVAEEAYRSLCTDGHSQSIIVSGESGAGKTISAKYIMRYFAEICASTVTDVNQPKKTEKNYKASVEDRVLATNPILEAFGNAKTVRNDNSSRFGKYVQIFFDKRNSIAGAAIKTYLLEKTRVVIQAKTERNFHIFYQLLAGCPEEERNVLKLGPWSSFRYLSCSDVGTIDEIVDEDEFDLTRKAMTIAGFSEKHQWNLFRVLAAILHIGNVEFVENGDGYAEIQDGRDALAIAAGLLGVEATSLCHNFLHRSIVAANETIEAYNDRNQAIAARDALAKSLYAATFNDLVQNLNHSLLPQDSCGKFVGVLDIYGFEKFDSNAFEQFCINYANERLQNLFNKHVFDLEQKLYIDEGIDWSFIKFHNNQSCINLIEAKLGVFDLLDEECRLSKSTDKSFVAKLYSEHNDSDSGKFLLKPKVGDQGKFIVKHFAYDVEYTASGFIEKNRDHVPIELMALLKSSSDDYISTLWGEGPGESKQDGRAITKPSTGLVFKRSLQELMELISSTKSHYIRCVKPNERKEPMQLDAPFVLQQLRACGVLETVRISAAGYPGRWSFAEFIERFRLLASDPCDLTKIKEPRHVCIRLLGDLKMASENYQVGKTRVFMRSGVLAALEEARTSKLIHAAACIQSTWKRCNALTFVRKCQKAIIIIQVQARKMSDFKLYLSLLEAKIGEHLILLFKRFTAMSEKLIAQKTSTTINSLFRRYACKTSVRQLLFDSAARLVVLYCRSCLCQRLLNAQYIIAMAIQSRYRRNLAWLQILKLREEARSVKHLKETSNRLEDRITELTVKLNLADEHIAFERQVNAKLRESIRKPTTCVNSVETDPIQEPKLDITIVTSFEEKIEALQKIIDELEEANAELFTRNEELARQIRLYRLEGMNSDRLSKSSQNQSLANIILRDTGTPPRSLQHLRALSHDSRIGTLSTTNVPVSTGLTMMSSGNCDTLDVCKALDDASCLTELLMMVESAQIPRTPDERAAISNARRPVQIITHWLLCWLTAGSGSDLVQSYLSQVLSHIKLHCTSLYEMPSTNRQQSLVIDVDNCVSLPASADRKFAFWIANLFDLLCFLQWASSETSNSESNSTPEGQLSERLLILLQLRTDVARVVEELYRAWLSDLFRYFSKLGVVALLDYQGLTGFTSDTPIRNPSASSSLKILMLPFAKLSEGASSGQGALYGQTIEDLIEGLDELADAMEASHLQPEIVIQLLSNVIGNFSSAAFNHLLLRKNYASWKRGIQIQYNLSRLEEWANNLNSRNPGYYFPQSSKHSSPRDDSCYTSAMTTSPLQQIAPLIQAVKLLQLAKTQIAADIDVLLNTCPSLNLAQIRKILAVYVPDAYEDGPVSPEILRALTLRIQQYQYDTKEHLIETLPECQPQNVPLQLSIRPTLPTPFAAIPTAAVPPHLWRIFALIDRNTEIP